MGIPPLAGLASYAEAARIGYSIDENVARLVRYAWIEKRIMETALYWLAPTPEWEVKEALGLHAYLAADHAADIRQRISEMRSPAPRMDISPDPDLDRFFEELLAAQTTLEKIVGLYGVLKPALLAAYRQHEATSSPIMDYPTRRMLKQILLDETDSATWGAAAAAALTETEPARQAAASWTDHLLAYLQGAGGIMGDQARPTQLPPGRARRPYEPDFFPQRDDRFTQRWNFTNPQRQVSLNEAVPLDERTLALMCRRVVEMDVPEYMTRIILQSGDEPWAYYTALTRQLWDEVRHAMLGSIYFESRGIDWRRLIAIHPGMAIRLGTLPVQDAHTVLYAIEQNLMPGNTGKRLEYEISKNAQDSLAAAVQDYDWADEVLHVHIGREWLLPRTGLKPNDAVKRGWELRAATARALDAYTDRGEQRNWWPDFVRAVLGRQTAVDTFDLTRL